ncbi:MAG: transglutaminase-like domain-containing protein, partial [Firmicutes bacterium]|nr:transglutaminase-like domain-containing protein [Bacillota bacterium]
MKTLTESQIKALIHLLGDNDIKTAHIARTTLIASRRQAEPYLKAAQTATDPYVRTRAYSILEYLRLDDLRQRFDQFASLPSDWVDLEDGALLIAETAHSSLEAAHYHALLDNMADGFKETLETMPGLRGRELIEALNQYFFHTLGFTGYREDHTDPSHIYLNEVIENRVGTPISLSTIYLLLARRLRIPVVGIGMPGHFLLQYNDSLFIDALENGQVLTRSECIQYLINNGFGFHPAYLSA